MRVIITDDEIPALDEMEYLLGRYENIEIIEKLNKSSDVLKHVAEKKPDAVFLDINMPGIDGIELALEIQKNHPAVIIIFVTAYSEYALDAFKAYPLDYLMKPVDETRLDKTIERLEEQVLASRHIFNNNPIHINCFGKFEIYIGESNKNIVKFPTKQVKELFAFLLCNSERSISKQELLDIVFGGNNDSKTVNLLHVTIYKLRRILIENGIPESSLSLNGKYTLLYTHGICDYIDFTNFIENNPYIDKDNILEAEKVARLYKGTFFEGEDYPWLVEFLAQLEVEYENLMLNSAKFYIKTNDIDKAEKTLITLLKYNPLSDEGNRHLLYLYMNNNDDECFKTHYLSYKKLLLEEFESEPEKIFTEYYKYLY